MIVSEHWFYFKNKKEPLRSNDSHWGQRFHTMPSWCQLGTLEWHHQPHLAEVLRIQSNRPLVWKKFRAQGTSPALYHRWTPATEHRKSTKANFKTNFFNDVESLKHVGFINQKGQILRIGKAESACAKHNGEQCYVATMLYSSRSSVALTRYPYFQNEISSNIVKISSWTISIMISWNKLIKWPESVCHKLNSHATLANAHIFTSKAIATNLLHHIFLYFPRCSCAKGVCNMTCPNHCDCHAMIIALSLLGKHQSLTDRSWVFLCLKTQHIMDILSNAVQEW